MQTFGRFVGTNSRWLAGGFLLAFFSSFGQTFFIALSGAELRGWSLGTFEPRSR